MRTLTDLSGQIACSGIEFGLKFESGHLRHAHVKKQASFPFGIVVGEKPSGAFVVADLQAGHFKHEREGCGDRQIVVDKPNKRRSRVFHT